MHVLIQWRAFTLLGLATAFGGETCWTELNKEELGFFFPVTSVDDRTGALTGAAAAALAPASAGNDVL